jgi:hypothetical protein
MGIASFIRERPWLNRLWKAAVSISAVLGTIQTWLGLPDTMTQVGRLVRVRAGAPKSVHAPQLSTHAVPTGELLSKSRFVLKQFSANTFGDVLVFLFLLVPAFILAALTLDMLGIMLRISVRVVTGRKWELDFQGVVWWLTIAIVCATMVLLALHGRL